MRRKILLFLLFIYANKCEFGENCSYNDFRWRQLDFSHNNEKGFSYVNEYTKSRKITLGTDSFLSMKITYDEEEIKKATERIFQAYKDLKDTNIILKITECVQSTKSNDLIILWEGFYGRAETNSQSYLLFKIKNEKNLANRIKFYANVAGVITELHKMNYFHSKLSTEYIIIKSMLLNEIKISGLEYFEPITPELKQEIEDDVVKTFGKLLYEWEFGRKWVLPSFYVLSSTEFYEPPALDNIMLKYSKNSAEREFGLVLTNLLNENRDKLTMESLTSTLLNIFNNLTKKEKPNQFKDIDDPLPTSKGWGCFGFCRFLLI